MKCLNCGKILTKYKNKYCCYKCGDEYRKKVHNIKKELIKK